MWLFGFIYNRVNYFHVYSLPKTDHLIKHLFLFRVTSWRKKGWRDNRWIQLAIFFTSTYRVKWLKSKLTQKVKINIDENNLKELRRKRNFWHYLSISWLFLLRYQILFAYYYLELFCVIGLPTLDKKKLSLNCT